MWTCRKCGGTMKRGERKVGSRWLHVIVCLTCDYFRADKSGPKNYKRKPK